MKHPINRVIITSGPTREWIDPVRYISNASSGKMGFEITKSFLGLVPEVIYIHGNTLEKYSMVDGASNNVYVDTTFQLRDAVLNFISDNCLLLMAAAPADFRPIMTAKNKIKKDKSETSQGLLLELEENPDILEQVRNYVEFHKIQNCIRIGFAAETEKLEEHAKGKLIRKDLHYIVGNYVGEGKGFGEVNSSVKIFGSEGLALEINSQSKENIAKEIVSFLYKKFILQS